MHERRVKLQAEKRTMGVVVTHEDRNEGGHLARVTIDNAAKLNTLPEPKREEVIKTLHRVVDEAAEVASPTRNPGSAPVRKD